MILWVSFKYQVIYCYNNSVISSKLKLCKGFNFSPSSWHQLGGFKTFLKTNDTWGDSPGRIQISLHCPRMNLSFMTRTLDHISSGSHAFSRPLVQLIYSYLYIVNQPPSGLINQKRKRQQRKFTIFHIQIRLTHKISRILTLLTFLQLFMNLFRNHICKFNSQLVYRFWYRKPQTYHVCIFIPWFNFNWIYESKYLCVVCSAWINFGGELTWFL